MRHARGWYVPGASCPEPLARAARTRLVRVARTHSTEAPGRTSQHRLAALSSAIRVPAVAASSRLSRSFSACSAATCARRPHALDGIGARRGGACGCQGRAQGQGTRAGASPSRPTHLRSFARLLDAGSRLGLQRSPTPADRRSYRLQKLRHTTLVGKLGEYRCGRHRHDVEDDLARRRRASTQEAEPRPAGVGEQRVTHRRLACELAVRRRADHRHRSKLHAVLRRHLLQADERLPKPVTHAALR